MWGVVNKFAEKAATLSTRWAGSSIVFVSAVFLTLGWLASGPYFDYSSEWNFFINDFSTVVTFLAIFLIQRSQNKESLAIQLKLNELILANERASNKMINIESLSESEIRELHARFVALAKEVGAGPASIDQSPQPEGSIMTWMGQQSK